MKGIEFELSRTRFLLMCIILVLKAYTAIRAFFFVWVYWLKDISQFTTFCHICIEGHTHTQTQI